MKKTIFDLTKEEGKKIDKELKKTSYFKQYLIGYYISTALLVIFCIGSMYGINESNLDYINIIYIVFLGFLTLLFLLFWFKRFDLIKKYYDEKIEK